MTHVYILLDNDERYGGEDSQMFESVHSTLELAKQRAIALGSIGDFKRYGDNTESEDTIPFWIHKVEIDGDGLHGYRL